MPQGNPEERPRNSQVDVESTAKSVVPFAAEAAPLRAAWDRRFRYGEGRKEMASLYGVHPSRIGQFLNGHDRISDLWRLRFAHFLQVPVRRIWPDFQLEAALLEALDRPLMDLLAAALAASPARVEAATVLLRERPA